MEPPQQADARAMRLIHRYTQGQIQWEAKSSETTGELAAHSCYPNSELHSGFAKCEECSRAQDPLADTNSSHSKPSIAALSLISSWPSSHIIHNSRSIHHSVSSTQGVRKGSLSCLAIYWICHIYGLSRWLAAKNSLLSCVCVSHAYQKEKKKCTVAFVS